MIRPGDIVPLEIERPASGGRMIARANGQVVLVSGVIPGEQARVAIERVGKGVAFGRAVSIERRSPDRREPPCDLECGGSLYGHIAYPRQLAIKGDVVADAMKRIAKRPWSSPVAVAASPEHGYRMRARLHWRDRRLGFFREGTHEVCDAAATGQLLPGATTALAALADALSSSGVRGAEIELSENVPGDQRVFHVDAEDGDLNALDRLPIAGVTGVTSRSSSSRGAERLHSGTPYVHDTLRVGGSTLTLRRHVGAFFQGNRYLLESLAGAVRETVSPDVPVVDLYAGVGLFSGAIAAGRRARVVAVEGDAAAAADLEANAAANEHAFEAVHQSVETFVARCQAGPLAVIVDPPRTGMSAQALQGIIRWAPGTVTYVSCDAATFARDARGLIDAGYDLRTLRAFDLFPNTPHVETLATFVRS